MHAPTNASTRQCMHPPMHPPANACTHQCIYAPFNHLPSYSFLTLITHQRHSFTFKPSSNPFSTTALTPSTFTHLPPSHHNTHTIITSLHHPPFTPPTLTPHHPHTAPHHSHLITLTPHPPSHNTIITLTPHHSHTTPLSHHTTLTLNHTIFTPPLHHTTLTQTTHTLVTIIFLGSIKWILTIGIVVVDGHAYITSYTSDWYG